MLGSRNTCKATVRVTSSGAQIVVVNFYIFYTFDTFLYFYTFHVQFLFVIMSRFRDCVLCLCIVPMKVNFIIYFIFLVSSLVLQVSQTHLVNKGEYSFFRESISTFQTIVLRQVIS